MIKWLLPGCFRQSTLIVHLISRTMENIFLLGRILFFSAMGFFGIQHFLYSTSITAPLLGPPWVPAGRFFALIVGAVLLVACASVATQRHVQVAGVLLGAVLLARVLFVNAPALAGNLRNGSGWTGVSELVAMCGACLFLAGNLPLARARHRAWQEALHWALKLGPFLFAMPLVVFGLQHFLYA